MINNAFNKFYWGFFFIMLDIKFQGVDILPDIIGYLLFAAGLNLIYTQNNWFDKARKLNIIMIFLSIFQIYERPVEGTGITLGPLGPVGVMIGLAATITGLLLIYNLFMGIGDMASLKGKTEIEQEVHERWKQYLMLQLAALLSFILIMIPLIGAVYIIIMVIISFIFAFVIMGFMKRCGNCL